MEKYIEVTGIATHSTLLLPCVPMETVTVDAIGPDFTFLKLVTLGGISTHKVYTVTFGSGTTVEADYLKAVNALLDDLYDTANSSTYTTPFLTRAADYYGLTISDITLGAS
jgi:hypothetical protein